MVNSRSDFEVKRKNEAFRRIRYSHPLVAGRTRFAKEAWKDAKKDNVTSTSNTCLEISLRPEGQQTNSNVSQQRVHTRKGPLRGLFYKCGTSPRRPATDPELSQGNDKEFIISNFNDTYPDWKRFKTKSCFPTINASSSYIPKTESTLHDDQSSFEKRTESDDSSVLYTDSPSYYDGWGRRKTKDIKNINFHPLVRTMDPITDCRHKADLYDYDQKQLPNVWVREQSLVRPLKGPAVRNFKQLNKLDVRFIK